MFSIGIKRALGGILALAAVCGAQDTFKYPGCPDVTRNNFTKVTIVDLNKDPSLDEPIRFAIAKDQAVYFAERNGVLKVVKSDGAIVKIGKLNVNPTENKLKINGNNELGLVGLALDPNFAGNHFIYVSYQPPSPSDSTRLSRFAVPNDFLDLNSETVLMAWPAQKNYCCHTAGGMQFDAKGDLWVSVGNNTRNPSIPNPPDPNDRGYVDETNVDADDQGHAANTNDYRGKILRIHPTADGKYTVPAGNLKDYYKSMWSAADLAKVKPEIYTLGHRNPYTISVDDAQGLLSWGEVGPDNGWDTEELNIVDKPGFMGWPYFAGAEGNAHYQFRLNKDPAAPLNTSKNNTGVQKLPPAIGATIGYRQSAAITGPVYRWTARQASPKKVPGHFDGKWFVSDYDAGWIHVVTLDEAGTKALSTASLLTGLVHPLQVTIAPDGILYVLEYATGYKFNPDGSTPRGGGSDGATRISRFEYTGAPCAIATSLQDRISARSEMGKTALVNLGGEGDGSISLPFGAKYFRLYNLKGNLAWRGQASGAGGPVALPRELERGLYCVKFGY